MKQFDHVVKDELGIHARPAGLLVAEAKNFPCEISISRGEKAADAKRIFAVMGLGVKCGETITLRCEGEQEAEACAALQQLLAACL